MNYFLSIILFIVAGVSLIVTIIVTIYRWKNDKIKNIKITRQSKEDGWRRRDNLGHAYRSIDESHSAHYFKGDTISYSGTTTNPYVVKPFVYGMCFSFLLCSISAIVTLHPVGIFFGAMIILTECMFLNGFRKNFLKNHKN